jgi:hypothetical protein
MRADEYNHFAAVLDADIVSLRDDSTSTQRPSTDSCDWPALTPFEATAAAAEAFPFAALGDLLGNAARAIAGDVQAPGALAGGSVMAAASLASSPLANVYMPHGQRAPLSLYVITGAASGDRKSATDAVACHAVDEQRKHQARKHAEDFQRWESESAGKKKTELTPPPAAQVLTTSNATTEGIAKLLKSQSVVGVFSAEGGEMLGGHSLRDDKRVAGMSFFLKAWGAEVLDSLRGGDGLSVLLGRRLSLHVLVQPVILGQLLSDPMANGQGLLARCLIAQPDTLAGTRVFRRVDPLANPATVRFNERIKELLNQAPRTWDTGDGFELKPDDLHMTPDASAAWVEFYNQTERAQAPGGELEGARPFASKAAEHAARIAGVVALVEGCNRIELSHMLGGIELAGFYLGEHLRLTGAGRTEQRNKQLRTLYEWMRGAGPTVLQATVLQKSPRLVRDLKAKGINNLLAELVERGYVREFTTGTWEVRDVQS